MHITYSRNLNAFPEDTAPPCLMRDRDSIYGTQFRDRVKNMGIDEVVSAARSPWQNPYVERLIGSSRRECLNHVIVLGENHRCRILKSYFTYYNASRTHLALAKDTPVGRAIERRGKVLALTQVGRAALSIFAPRGVEHSARRRRHRTTRSASAKAIFAPDSETCERPPASSATYVTGECRHPSPLFRAFLELDGFRERQAMAMRCEPRSNNARE
jgi:hypothetical protein